MLLGGDTCETAGIPGTVAACQSTLCSGGRVGQNETDSSLVLTRGEGAVARVRHCEVLPAAAAVPATGVEEDSGARAARGAGVVSALQTVCRALQTALQTVLQTVRVSLQTVQTVRMGF